MYCIDDHNNQLYSRLFFVSYSLWLTAGALNMTMFRHLDAFNLIFSYMQNSAYLLLVFLFFLKKRNTKQDAIGIGIILLCCILARHSVYNTYIIPASFFLYFSINIDFKQILKCTLIIQALVMVVTITSSQVGIIEDEIWVQNSGIRIRHSLGYDYCGYPAHYLFFMTMIWFCIRKKPHVIEMLVAVALNYVMYIFTDSRSDLALALLGIIGFTFWDREYIHKWMNNSRAFIVKFGFLILTIISILAQFFYREDNGIFMRVNHWLNDRLRLGHEAIQNYGFSLFGKEIHWFGQIQLRDDSTRSYNYVDNAFLKEGLSFGLIFLVLLVIAFYLTGKALLAHKEYKLTWAMVLVQAYAVINAQLCMLAFNAFILLPVYAFREIKHKDLPIGEWVSHWIKPKWKRILRTGLFLVILFTVTYVQIRGTSYAVSNARMYTWIICGILFVIACLCQESDPYQIKITSGWFGKLLLAFFILLCISDFFVSKEFRFAAFGMLAFGGIFCKCWGTMKDPEQLLEEFKFSYKFWFVISMIYCIFCRPWTKGICYSGLYPDADSFALAMLIATVLFLSDLQKKSTAILNGIGMFCALYMIWISHVMEIILLAGVIVLLYVVCWIWTFINAQRDIRLQRIRNITISILISAVVIWIIRSLLPIVSEVLGSQVVYEDDVRQEVGLTFAQMLHVEGWMELFNPKWNVCVEYLKNMNLLGHNYLLEIDGNDCWAPNSPSMVGYRYGFLAGAAYLILCVTFLCCSVAQTVKEKNFYPAGLAIGCTAVAMIMPVEKPFICLTWLVLWFAFAGKMISISALNQH